MFVSARAPAPKVVIYTADDGSETVREGGSRAWRNFNPGNIEAGSFANENGAIGTDGRFAIFPDETTGRDAITTLLGGPSYRNLTLEEAINRYAPPSENNTAGYVAFVEQQTGIPRDTVLKDVNLADRRKIAAAIKKIEGWIPGEERPNKPFSAMGAEPIEPVSSAAVAADDWLDIAGGEAALPEHERSEWSGSAANPRIMKYFETAAPWFDAKALGGDEVDWCAAFVNYCLETAGYRGTGHPGARSFFWNKDNHFISVPGPKVGSIAVFRDAPFDDADWESGTGHVGFVVDWNDDTLELLGGNQGHTVKRQIHRRVQKDGNTVKRKVVAFMFPTMN